MRIDLNDSNVSRLELPNYGLSEYEFNRMDSTNLSEGLSGPSSRSMLGLPKLEGASGGLMSRIGGVLGNEGLMKGILGAGQLGLGIASYLGNRDVQREQMKALRQNRQFAAEDQQARRNVRSAWEQADLS